MNAKSSKIPYLKSTSTSDTSTQTPRSNRATSFLQCFDPRNPTDKTILLRWCEEHWLTTFRKSMQSSNPLFYHDCCSAFSRRAFSKLAGHPPLQSSPVHRIPSFKEVCSSTDLYQWLLGKLSENHRRGQKVFFPAINRVHYDLQEEGLEDVEDEVQTLHKRLEQVGAVENKLTSQINSLKDDNEKLFNSTKAWYLKYQELADKQDQTISSLLGTPMKKKPKPNFEVLDDIFY